jgi:hypothetical protein
VGIVSGRRVGMHGLVNRSIQMFTTEVYGADTWASVVAHSARGRSDFHALSTYEDIETELLMAATERVLRKSAATLLEDIGIWLVTGESRPVRRLLRFCGTDFVEFLHSLDELPGRARLGIDGLELPSLELREHTPGLYTLALGPGMPGFGRVLLGMLRAMADDYGALALIEHCGGGPVPEMLEIRVVQTDYTQGRAFDLLRGRA